MFYADNMNCIFNYTIPGIINAIAVLSMMQYEDFRKEFSKFSIWRKSTFIFLIYFSIFSNLFHSCLVVIYCGVILLFEFVDICRQRAWNIKKYLKENRIYLLILCTWLLAVLFEMNGSRAGSVTRGNEFSIETSIRQLWALINAIGIPFKIISILSLVWLMRGVIQTFRKKKEKKNCCMYLQVLFILGLVMIYLLVLCAAVNYMSRIEASWNIWFCLILVVIMGIADFVSSHAQIKLGGIILIVAGVLALYPDGKFMMSTVKNLNYETCVNTGKYVADQIIKADREGKRFVVVHSPVYTEEQFKWVFGDSFPVVVMNTLYDHGIIQNRLEIETCNDAELINLLLKK